MKILIAEDDPGLQNLNQKLMNIWGFECDIAGNGKEAVKYAEGTEQYDICLMDIEMPVMDGLIASKIIRKKVKYFPIIAVSANLEYKDRCFQIGIDAFMKKPYDVDELYQKINEFNVKQFIFKPQNGSFILKMESPMDQQHARELRELARKDLRKVKFFDHPGSTVIVHKNVTNKISHDFIYNEQLLTKFINRDPEKPTMCELYKESNYLMPQTFLAEDEVENLITLEDKELLNFPEPALKRENK